MLQLIVFIALFALLVFLLYKKLGKRIMFAICLPLNLCGYFFISYSLQQAPAYMVMMIFAIIVTSKLGKWDWDKLIYSAMIVGSLTCFFDFLTTPILTLVLPLIIFVLYYCKEKTIKNKDLFYKVAQVCISWGLRFWINMA